MNRDPREYVERMDLAIRSIAEWTAEGHEAFVNDLRTRAAVLRMLQELSESVRRLEPLLASRYPEFPWREVIAFRNVVVHDYMGLNFERIWTIATRNLPALQGDVRRMLAELA